MEANLNFWQRREQRGGHFWFTLLRQVRLTVSQFPCFSLCGVAVRRTIRMLSLHSVRLPCPAVQGPAHFFGSLAVLLHITRPAENAMDEAGKQAVENKNIVVFRLSLPAQRGPPVSSPACGLPFKAAPCPANLLNLLNMPSSLLLFPPACLQTWLRSGF